MAVMVKIPETIAGWRIDPGDDRTVQTKGHKKGAEWEEYGSFDTPAIANEVVQAGRSLLAMVGEETKQRRVLKLPRGDLRLPDGRTLRKIIGYDLSKVPMPANTANNFLASGGWRNEPTGLIVSAGIEDTERWGPLLHISMSYPDHDPKWEEIKALRDAFFPKDVDVAMILPTEQFYVNVHRHCFHLWQTPTTWGIG